MSKEKSHLQGIAILHDIVSRSKVLAESHAAGNLNREEVEYSVGGLISLLSHYWHVTQSLEDLEYTPKMFAWMRRSIPDINIGGQPFQIVPPDCKIPNDLQG